MILQGLIAYKPHATNAAMKLDAFEDLILSDFGWSKQKKGYRCQLDGEERDLLAQRRDIIE